jgi:predicted lipoprotein with Yx(FWY)xxD motif
MPHFRSTLFAMPLLALALAACSSDSDGSSDTTAPVVTIATTAPADTSAPADTTAGADGATSVALADSSLGSILVDGTGRTLYLFTADAPGAPACAADCLGNWPPLPAADAPTLGEGLDAEDFATAAAADGTEQVTFYGHPLYYFAGDTAAGDVNGQGVGGKWFVVDSEGNPVQS